MATNTKKGKKTTASATKRKTPGSSKKKRKNKKVQLSKKSIIQLCISFFLIAGLLAVIFTVKGKKPDGKPIPLTGDTAWGIDVSSHNGKINWEKAGTEAQFAFIRVGYRGYTEGEINTDSRAAYNLKHANKQRIPAGVYFYSQAISVKEAEEEAEFALKAIQGYDISLPVVIDFEYAMNSGKHTGRLFEAKMTSKERTAVINAFCNKVRDAGYTPGIYASSYIYKTELNMKHIPKDVFIWVADYNKSVTYNGYYDIWQYSEKGKCSGVSSAYVDTNYFYLQNRL